MIDLPLNASPDVEEDNRKTIDASDIGELKAEAQRRIEAAADDPAIQSYFVRADTNTVIKTEAEYDSCQKQGIQLKIVSYAAAKEALRREDAKAQEKVKAKKKRKMARKSRKQNR